MPGPNAAARSRRSGEPKNVPPSVTACDPPALQKTYTVSDGFKNQRIKFLPASRDWYRAWCARGVDAGFGETDWLFLRDIVAPMYDRYRRGGSVERVKELRMQLTVLEKMVVDRQAARPATDDDEATEDEKELAKVIKMIRPSA